MRKISHKSVLGILREHLAAWRRKPVDGKQLSREKAIHQIVEAHRLIGGPAITGIEFEEKLHDPVTAQKNNADRVSRWLDDESKDNNFMPANFLPSMLAGLPMDVRIECANEILGPCGLAVRAMVAQTPEIEATRLLNNLLKENAESGQAMARLITSGALPDLKAAHKELTESLASNQEALTAVEGALARLVVA